MSELPFNLPQSVSSYLEQFDNNPQKTVKRFKNQLKRRGPDAVGYFILGWFYYQQGKQSKAVDCALRAKTLAPGSPFFEKLHFYFSHPQLFDARYLPTSTSRLNQFDFDSSSDLDSLIEKISRIESTRIKMDPKPDSADEHQPFDGEETNDIVSETLATVHKQQGNLGEAIRVYQLLKNSKKGKADFYDEQIEKLKELQAKERKN